MAVGGDDAGNEMYCAIVSHAVILFRHVERDDGKRGLERVLELPTDMLTIDSHAKGRHAVDLVVARHCSTVLEHLLRSRGLAMYIQPLAAKGYLSLQDLSQASKDELKALDTRGHIVSLSEAAKEDTVSLEIPPRLYEVSGDAAKLIALTENEHDKLSYHCVVKDGGIGGSRAGDVLVAIAGAPVKKLTFEDVMKMREETQNAAVSHLQLHTNPNFNCRKLSALVRSLGRN